MNDFEKKTVCKKNPRYDIITYEDIVNCKIIPLNEVIKDYNTLCKRKDYHKTPCSDMGNRIIYQYQFPLLLETNRKKKDDWGQKIKDEFSKDFTRKGMKGKDGITYWIDEAIKMDREKKKPCIYPVSIFEAFRKYGQSVNTFKAVCTKLLLEKYNNTNDGILTVFDPTAGWGGRMLGAASSGHNYIGCDTNIELKIGYDKMIKDLNLKNVKIIYDDFRHVDLSTLGFDTVITSPPYKNVEQYNGMKLFETDEDYFYFLKKLINDCLKFIKPHGYVIINIKDALYEEYLKHGGIECDFIEELPQAKTKHKNREKVFIFKPKKKKILYCKSTGKVKII